MDLSQGGGLIDCPVLFIDFQSTGAVPPKAHLIEMGWSYSQNINDEAPIFSSFVKLPETHTLPPRISQLTGISETDLVEAPDKEVLWRQVWEHVPSATPLIIHFAQFERPFLKELCQELPHIFCTFEIARRLFPEIPSRSLRAISGHLGHSVQELKRSHDHIAATRYIWRYVAERLSKEHGIRDFEALNRWLDANPVKLKNTRKKSYLLPAHVRLSLPDEPGIYKFKNLRGEILYVGKASSLKSRVNSYFRGQKTKGARLNELTSQIASVAVATVQSPLEAALLESDAIKTFNPPYNRALKKEARDVAFWNDEFSMQKSGRLLGPFSSPSFVELVATLRLLVENSGEGGMEGVDTSTLKEAIKVFRARYFPSSCAWRRLLVRLWGESIERARALRKLGDEEVEDEEDEEEALDESLTPEDIAERIKSTFTAFAHRVHRGRFLIRLANCQLYWQSRGSQVWHSAIVKNGLAEFKLAKHARAGTFAKHSKDPPEIFNVATYDRLQVLTTEIRRLIKESNKVLLFFPHGRKLDEFGIAKFMFPGAFDETN
ncbi:MAG: GIY-YIG nuclease family protein [Deltaproteobacteria bacterium]|nr:GIY-YIG nuclease family protein [Deltaproteobacteria bacterium]